MAPILPSDPAQPEPEGGLSVAQRDQALRLIGRHAAESGRALGEDHTLTDDLGITEMGRVSIETEIESVFDVDVFAASFSWVTVGDVLRSIAEAKPRPVPDLEGGTPEEAEEPLDV